MKVLGSQLERMQRSNGDAFYDQLNANVVTFMAEASPKTPPDELQKRINAARVTAEPDGMLSERDITRYVHLLAALPLDYRDQPETRWLVAILQSSANAEAKLNQISTLLNEGRV